MKLEKLIIGSTISFAEAGTTIDGILVTADAFPDDDPVENWASLGCVSETNIEPETETDTDYCANALGIYEKIDDERVVAVIIKFQVRDHSEQFWRMILGVPVAIADGVVQIPFSTARRYIDGWVKIDAFGDDGVKRINMLVWGRLTVDAAPKWSKDATKPALKFQKFYSAISTVTPTAIIA